MMFEKEKIDLTPLKYIPPAKDLPPSNSLKRSLKQFESLLLFCFSPTLLELYHVTIKVHNFVK